MVTLVLIEALCVVTNTILQIGSPNLVASELGCTLETEPGSYLGILLLYCFVVGPWHEYFLKTPQMTLMCY